VNRKNLHLLISVAIVIPAAFFYGSNPEHILPYYFAFEVNTADLKSVFRALMGLYLSFSLLWIIGILKPNFWKVATLANGFFMCGIALGRLLSLVIDGISSDLFFFGFFGEVILGIFAFYQYQKFSQTT
jgi:hypothetical protein